MPLFCDMEELLAHEVPIIASGQRLADTLRVEWARRCRNAGDIVWSAPPVQTWEQLLEECWQRLLHEREEQVLQRLVLNRNTEHVLWERIISEDPECLLLQPGAAASHALSAHSLLQRWRVNPEEEKYATEFRLSHDGRRFLQWRREFLQICEQKKWCSQGMRDELILQALQKGMVQKLPGMILFGFEPMEFLPPLHRSLIEAIAVQTIMREAPAEQPEAQLRSCQDPESELYACACWALERIRQNPDRQLAVAVPELDRRRVLVERVFREVFEPAGILPEAPPSEGLFNLAAPQSLLLAPIVSDALRLLELVCRGLPPKLLRPLLDSPFWCAEEEKNLALGGVGTDLLAWRAERVSATALCARAEQRKAVLLTAALRNLSIAHRRADSSAWVRQFRDWLQNLGWPGKRRFDSAEYQQEERFAQILDEFAAGMEVYGRMDASEALRALRNLLQGTSFQPRSGAVQLHILDLNEVCNLNFDELWISGMEQSIWPPAKDPNPLLPGSLQRALGMPHADPQRERQGNERSAQKLLHAARCQLVLSYPQSDRDKQLGMPNFLAEGMPSATAGAEEQDPYRNWLLQIHASGCRERLPEERAVPCSSVPVRATTSLLNDQASCAFRAFAHHRLGVYARPEYAAPGLRAMDRGVIMHRALQSFWEQMSGSAELAECSAENRQRLIAAAVSDAIFATAVEWEEFGAPAQPRFWTLERTRLECRLADWLDQEMEYAAQNGGFEICATEQKREYSLDSIMHFRLRIDHLEKYSDDTLLVLDYKTGRALAYQAKNAQKIWAGPYPRDLQLPLYALACADQGVLRALGWGLVDVRNMKRIIVELDPQRWEEWQREIRETILLLAKEYCAGTARVAPHHTDSCQNCGMQPLCRIRELR